MKSEVGSGKSEGRRQKAEGEICSASARSFRLPTSDFRLLTSTRAVFFSMGLGVAAWAPLVPFAKSRLHVDERALGLLLLCAGTGSLLTMPFSGLLAARYGCRRLILLTGAATCVALPCLAVAGNIPGQAAALLGFGAAVGTLDAVVNIQAVLVEKAAGRALMSGFHGLYSVGTVAGAAGVSALLWAGAPPLAAALAIAGSIGALLAGYGRGLLPGADAGGGPGFAWPRGTVALIGLLCFLAFVAEGSVSDWSAVFLTASRGVAPARAGVGFAAFAAAMTLGRLGGDPLTRAFGGRVVLAGSAAGAAGLLLVAAGRTEAAALAGFALAGLGSANLAPVLFSSAGRQTDMPPHLAIPAVTTLGYTGFLAGPALIGVAAHAWGLPVAFAGVAALLLVVAACARRVSELHQSR